ncbi:MAG: OmpA family protein, partial [Bacteroidetes bacterium]|nr:OmpA family protein [Bacteroidota bacterium]
AAELERLIGVLNKIPALKIELSSHTDSKGADDYNQRLSEARAKSVVEYLISHGVNANRLQFKGYGETQPVAPNTLPDGSDNPDGRQLNRRTEFTIMEM